MSIQSLISLARNTKPVKSRVSGKAEDKSYSLKASGIVGSGGTPLEVFRATVQGLSLTIPLQTPNAATLAMSESRSYEGAEALVNAYCAVFGVPAGLSLEGLKGEALVNAKELLLALATAVHAGEEHPNTKSAAAALLVRNQRIREAEAKAREEEEARQRKEAEKEAAANGRKRN